MHAHTDTKFGNMIRSLFLLLLLVGITLQMPPNATIRMRFVVDKTIFRMTFPGTDQRLTRVANMLNNVTSHALGIHIQRLPRSRIDRFEPAEGEEFSAYFERLGKEGAVNSTKYRDTPAEFLVILTLHGTEMDEKLANWSHTDKDVCRAGSFVLMSVSRAGNGLKSDEELRDELLKLLLLVQFGIEHKTGSECDCYPPCHGFHACAKKVIERKMPECLKVTRIANTTADFVAICGNGLVEKGESCDCVVSDSMCRKCCNMSACYKLDPCRGVPNTNTTTETTGKGQADMILVISLIFMGMLLFLLLVVSVVMLQRRRRAKTTTRTTRQAPNSDSWSSTTSGVGSAVLKSEKTKRKPERKTPPLKPV